MTPMQTRVLEGTLDLLEAERAKRGDYPMTLVGETPAGKLIGRDLTELQDAADPIAAVQQHAHDAIEHFDFRHVALALPFVTCFPDTTIQAALASAQGAPGLLDPTLARSLIPQPGESNCLPFLGLLYESAWQHRGSITIRIRAGTCGEIVHLRPDVLTPYRLFPYRLTDTHALQA